MFKNKPTEMLYFRDCDSRGVLELVSVSNPSSVIGVLIQWANLYEFHCYQPLTEQVTLFVAHHVATRFSLRFVRDDFDRVVRFKVFPPSPAVVEVPPAAAAAEPVQEEMPVWLL